MVKKATARKHPARRGRARKTAATRGSSTSRAAHPQVTVRHYCQGIGDCHLLKFTKDDGGDYWMLIDCGVHTAVSGGSQKIDDIVGDIFSATDRLDVIVATHEHTDHLSGFASAAEKFAQFDVGEIWMGWTENPADAQARALDKYKDQALTALQLTSRVLDGATGLSPHLATARDGLQSVLGFQFGAKGDKVRAMRDALVELAPRDVRYFEPKDPPITIPGLSNLRIYVLGPPRDPAMIKVTERASEMYGLAGGGWTVAQALANGIAAHDGLLSPTEDCAAPFDSNMGIPLSRLIDPNVAQQSQGIERSVLAFLNDHYLGPARQGVSTPAGANSGQEPDPAETDQSWRRIDLDWLGASADLAIQLDKKTNNSSLVLAFEFIETGRVMLFVGDAQVGNWLSWQDLKWRVGDVTVTGPDLLARTVFYKVGHHGSENATLKQKGLELMTQPDLAAFIPTNEKDAKKVRWGEMPFSEIVEELDRRTSGRVIRADDPWIATQNVGAGFRAPSGAVLGLRHQQGLWVELDIA